MKTNNVVRNKSFALAIRIVNLYRQLFAERKEFVMSKQLLRSGTSVGANIREAVNAQSKPGFTHKLTIAQKECDETLYWLELLKETGYLTEIEFNSIYKDGEEVFKIIRSIIITTKANEAIKKGNR
jgi:four helix bundle protein